MACKRAFSVRSLGQLNGLFRLLVPTVLKPQTPAGHPGLASRIWVWMLTTIWPREIFGWSKCNKRSPGASAVLLEPKPLLAFAAICPPCANKASPCCRLRKPLFVVIPSFLHSRGPRQVPNIRICLNAHFRQILALTISMVITILL
jgi:hypothetical protein